jgi:sugar porter (SP) family MFS transporter
MELSAAGNKAERIETGAHSRSYVILLATIAAISGFLFGFNTAVINGVLLFLRRQFTASNLQTEIAASSVLVGALLGAAMASMLGDRYGRKKSLMLSAALFVVSPLGAAAANSILAFSIARFVCGLAIGLTSVLTPVYIAEISPSKNRGALVSLNQLALVTGILVSYLVSWRFSAMGNQSWRWMLAVAVVPAIAFFGGLFAIPESPRWLVGNGRTIEAERILARIIGADAAKQEVISIIHSAAGEQGSWSEVFSRNMRGRLGIGMALALFSQVTGVNTVLYYGSVIISEHFPGQSTNTALLANVVIGTVNLIFTVAAMIFLDRWGRRAILMTASGGMFLALTFLVISLNLRSSPAALMLIAILFYVGFFAFGLGPGPWLIISEIFPTKVRGRAASIATSTLWSGALLVTFTFLTLVKLLNLWGTFAIYGALSFVCLIYVWRMVPETKGKTLEQIQEFWENGRSPARDNASRQV